MNSVLLQAQAPGEKLRNLLDDWREDSISFLRHDVPKIVWALVVAFILLMIFRMLRRKLLEQSRRQDLPTGLRAQQLRTLAGIIYSVGVVIVIFYLATTILPILGLNIGPLLASAGIAGFAIGFGAQTLVKDFINGFFILVENTFDIGDTIRTAGVQGTVESITLRRTILRDFDGTVHTVPNSQMSIISNFTRDWAQLALQIAVDYKENSDKVVAILKEVATDVYEDERFHEDIVTEPEVPGIEKVTGEQVDYLMLVKTRPGKQFAISREFRRQIKERFEKNGIKPGTPNRVYVVGDSSRPSTPA
jgi:small-conductance mechanosensitive channel